MNLLDLPPEVIESPDAFEADRVKGNLSYENAGFTYAGRDATLSGVTFEVPAGRKIGIVGPTGAGKTTLVSLLPRFYELQEGRILIDGRDIRSFSLASLRRQVSFVHQEPMLFSGTIEHNIRYGRIEATADEVVQAAEAANARSFIEQLPHGYETVLGEDGSQLSGGERQRIAIARAFLKDAPILVLDEPTASVDLRTESEILDALDRLVEGRTTLLIAHRLSTLRGVDLVLVLDHGRIVESGSRQELLAQDGLYARLYKLQAGRPAGTRAGLASQPLVPSTDGAEAALGFPELWRLRAARMLLDEVRLRLEERSEEWLETFEQQADSDPDVRLALALRDGSLLDGRNGKGGRR